MKNERKNHCFCSWSMQICDALYTRMVAGMTTVATKKCYRGNENDEYWIFIDWLLMIVSWIFAAWLTGCQNGCFRGRGWWSCYVKYGGWCVFHCTEGCQVTVSKTFFQNKYLLTESFPLILTHGWEHFPSTIVSWFCFCMWCRMWLSFVASPLSSERFFCGYSAFPSLPRSRF